MLMKSVVVLVLTLVLFTVYNRLVTLGVFKSNLYSHAPGACRVLPGHNASKGSEDLKVLPSGVALVSSGLLTGDGVIQMVDLKVTPERAEVMKISGPWTVPPHHFRPHGISTWTDPKTGEITLGVVNHHGEGERVELFKVDVKSKTLHFIRTVDLSGYGEMNDLLLVDDSSFYVTELLLGSASTTLPIETVLQLPTTRLFFYDGQKVHKVASGLVTANGVAASPDGRYLYVAEMMGNRLSVFQRHPNSPSLTFLHHEELGTSVDNLEVDMATGDVWVGAHPNFGRLLLHLLPSPVLSPSQVLRLRMKDGHVEKVTEVLYDTGSFLALSSVAFPYQSKLIVGTVSEKLVVCDRPYLD